MKEKIKIVHVLDAFGGGVLSFLVDLVEETANDFDITIIHGIREETPANYVELFPKKVKFIHVAALQREINPKKEWQALNEVKKHIHRIDPDVVHCHSSKAGVIGRFAANGKRRKVFYTPHGYAFLKQDDSKLKRNIYKEMERIAALRKSTTVACSKGEYEETLHITRHATYINNGINIDKMEKLALSNSRIFHSDTMKVCTIGRTSYQKNPFLFNQIASSFPDISFTWIGDGDLSHQLTSSNITLTGWKSRQEGLEIVSQSDVFILPSLWEGLPISLLEAMYLKKICIVSNVVGNRDVIEHGRNGFVATTLEEFCELIQEMKEEKYDLDRIRQNAYEDIMQEYNTKKMAERYRRLYQGEEEIK